MTRTPRTARRLGQNFLVDRGAVRRIVEALEVGPEVPVLEIGPGRGALTKDLIAAAGRIAAVELDPRLAEALVGRFDESRLLLRRDDILRVDLERLGMLLGRGTPGWAVAGNLPYSISKPVAMKLVRDRRWIDRAVLMFQREVAERLTAEPGTRRYGPLTVLAGAAYRIERLFDLSPSAFRPAPKVSSTVTRWRRLPAGGLDDEEETKLRACLAACFRQRRRTLRNNLRQALGSERQAEALLEAAGIDPSLRAEAVTPPRMRRLAANWPPAPR